MLARTNPGSSKGPIRGALLLLALFLPTHAWPQENPSEAKSQQPFGKVAYLTGYPMAQSRSLKVGDVVYLGESLSVPPGAKLRILLGTGEAAFQVYERSRVRLAREKNGVHFVELLQGAVLSAAKKSALPTYGVRTKFISMAGVEEGEAVSFFARLKADGRVLQHVYEGKLKTSWREGDRLIQSRHDHRAYLFSRDRELPERARIGKEVSGEDAKALQALL